MLLLEVICLFLISLWGLSFAYNVYYFFKLDDSDIDTVFINSSKTFEEAHQKLNTLEKYIGRSLENPRRKLNFYAHNAKLTRRKYRYYADKVEPSLAHIFIGSEGSRFKKCWEQLDQPVKYHYINIFVFLSLFSVLITLFVVVSFGWAAIIVLLFLVLILLRLYNFIIKINLLFFYLLLDMILIIFKQDRGKLLKNVAILEILTQGWFGESNRSGYLIGAAGVAAFGGYSGGGGLGGFGGGSFGGGGAGGSW